MRDAFEQRLCLPFLQKDMGQRQSPPQALQADAVLFALIEHLQQSRDNAAQCQCGGKLLRIETRAAEHKHFPGQTGQREGDQSLLLLIDGREDGRVPIDRIDQQTECIAPCRRGSLMAQHPPVGVSLQHPRPRCT